MRRAQQRQSSGDQRHRGRPVRVTAAMAVAVVVAAVGAQSAPAADSFERGDVLASVGSPSVIARFAPDGTAKGTLADSAGAGPLCFDPSGEHLIAPGAGLYDNAGSLLASDWKTVASPGACTVDASGNVFMARGPYSGDTLATRRATFRRFDLTGHLRQSYDVDATGETYVREVYTVDLAPDQCTIYYGLGGGSDVKRYDVCTGTQQAPFGSGGFPCDELRVRPNGQVVMTCDSHGALLDASGIYVSYFPNPTDSPSLRYAALDADGSSFWMGAGPGLLTRIDIASGQQLASWSAGPVLNGVAVYSPPPPAQQNTEASFDHGEMHSGASSNANTTTPAHTATITAPAVVIARGRLIASRTSLRLDTGLRVTCPAGGPRCHASVALTVGTTEARAAAASHTTRVGTLNTTIVPGAKAKLVVRLNKKGSAVLRQRRVVTVATRATIRAGSAPAVVTNTSIRVRLRRAR
jgi:hypothetical protein